MECADDGHKALEKINTTRPDALLLDLMMPGLDGWGVLDRLRLMPDPPPVVVLPPFADRYSDPDDSVAAFLSKPFVVPDLIRTCEKVSAA